MALKIGDKCPLFTLPDQHGNPFNIGDLLGKKLLVIYFYPKDDTPGCTKEACFFRDSYEDFKELGCEVIGISSDDQDSHKKFAEQYKLPFVLLSDHKSRVRKVFGVPANLFGLIPGRVTYIIDRNGIIRGVHNSLLDPKGHLEMAKTTVQQLL